MTGLEREKQEEVGGRRAGEAGGTGEDLKGAGWKEEDVGKGKRECRM